MKKIFISIFLFLPLILFSQNYIDENKKMSDAYQKDNFAEALSFSEKALKSAKQEFGEYNATYLSAINNNCLISLHLQKYEGIEKKLLFALQICDSMKLYETSYIDTYGNLSNYYNAICNFYQSEIYLQKLIDYNYKNKQWADYYVSQLNLAEIYRNNEKYHQAIKIYDSCLEKIKNINLIYYAYYLNNYGLTFYEYGNYQKAKELYLEALEILDKRNLKNSIYYNDILNNLFAIYSILNQETTKHTEQLLENTKKVFGKKSNSYINISNNLCILYIKDKKIDKAEKLLKQNYKTIKKNKNDYFIISSFYSVYANLMIRKKNIDKAIFFYNKALEILEQNDVPEENIKKQEIKINIAKLLIFNNKNKNEATEQFINSIKIINKIVYQNCLYLSENEKQILLDKHKTFIDELLNLTVQNTDNQSLQEFTLNTIIEAKYKLLELSKNTKIFLENIQEAEKKKSLLEYYALRFDYTKKFFSESCDSIELVTKKEKILEYEANLIKQLNEDEIKQLNLITEKTITWKDIQNNITENEAVIEYINFNAIDNFLTYKTKCYAAFVITKNTKYPQIKYLCKSEPLDSILNLKSQREEDFILNFYKKNEHKISNNNILYDLIFKPLENELTDIKHINIIPTGILHRISFFALQKNTDYLYNLYNIKQLTTSKRILHDDNFYLNSDTKIALWGGIDYENIDNKEYEITDFFVDLDTLINRNFRFRKLEYSFKEINNLTDTLKKYNISNETYKSKEATIYSFLKYNNTKTDILHISTHGLYIPFSSTKYLNNNNLKDKLSKTEAPLMRSILAFAGANKNESDSLLSSNYGILTAYDISNMNLSKTDLVVLSACQTALGELQNEEVFGLQRAFIISGVKNMVLTLWSIPDEAAYLFMLNFYNNLIKGQELKTAFANAQNTMREKYKSIGCPEYFWAGFVLIN